MHLFLPPKFTLFIPLPCHLMIPEFYETCCADDWSLITCARGKAVIMTSIFPFYPVSQDTLVFAIPYCSLTTPENYCLPTVHPLLINLPSCLFQKIPWSYWVLLAEPFICILVERTILWDVKLLMICRFQASIFTCLRMKSISLLNKSFTRTIIRSKKLANQEQKGLHFNNWDTSENESQGGRTSKIR